MLPGVLVSEAADAERPAAVPRTPRDWVVDVVLFAVCVAAFAGELVGIVVPNAFGLPGWLLVVDVVLGAVACLAVWWRRRYPTATGVLGVAIGAVANTAVGALFVLLFSLAVHRGWTRAVPVTVVGALVAVPYIVVYFPGVIGDPLLFSVVIALAMVLCTTAGLAVRARRQLVVALRARADDLRREHELRVAETRRDERERIAREMHDVLAHRISLLSVHAGALEYRTAMAEQGGTPPTAAEVHEAVAVVRSNAHLALQELQDVLRLLRDPATDGEEGAAAPQPTADRIPALIGEARRSGQTVTARVDDGLTALPASTQRTVYRLLQEGLTNARKHAPGVGVEVEVARRGGGEVVVCVVNAVPVGVTTAEIPGARRGLLGLAERVERLGGRLDSGIDDGRFRLHARIPA